MNVPFHEYWSFLDSFLNLKSKEGLEKIDTYLKQKLFQRTIDAQFKAAQEILHDTNNDDEIFCELNNLLETIELIKRKFEFKENFLSQKYDLFSKLMSALTNKQAIVTLPVSFTSVWSYSTTGPKDPSEEPQEVSFYECLVNDFLAKYIATIIEVSRLDKTGRAHLNLYKPAKSLLELVHCQKVFENFYLTPAFRRTLGTNSRRSDKFEVKSKLKFDIEEEEDNKEEEKKSRYW